MEQHIAAAAAVGTAAAVVAGEEHNPVESYPSVERHPAAEPVEAYLAATLLEAVEDVVEAVIVVVVVALADFGGGEDFFGGGFVLFVVVVVLVVGVGAADYAATKDSPPADSATLQNSAMAPPQNLESVAPAGRWDQWAGGKPLL